MMKAVLISTRPKWCEEMASGKKTIEVRKSRPKLETPFKVYIYMTATKRRGLLWEYDTAYQNSKGDIIDGSQKVIGEFVCDRIDRFYCASVPYRKENNLGYEYFVDNGVYKVNGWDEGVVFERNDRYIDSMLKNNDLDDMCLSAQEIFDYIGIGKYLYAWHISQLKIYDKPKELSEFNRICNENCQDCKYAIWETNGAKYEPYIVGCLPLKRPPQSWCYVEELQE